MVVTVTSPWKSVSGRSYRFNPPVMQRVAARYGVPDSQINEFMERAAAADNGDRFLNARELTEGAENLMGSLSRPPAPEAKKRKVSPTKAADAASAGGTPPPSRPPSPTQLRWSPGQDVVYATTALGPRPAVVRFCGELPGHAFLVGIEFLQDCAAGRHDGSLPDGARGFTCPPGRGLYLHHDSPRLFPVRDYSEEERQAVATASLKLEERIEAGISSKRIRRKAQHKELGKMEWMKSWASEKHAQKAAEAAMSPPRARARMAKVAYGGPRTEAIGDEPISAAEARSVFEHIAAAPDQPLHPAYLLSLISRGTEAWEKSESVARLKIAPKSRVIVLGDTHGHLKDFIHAVQTFGPPSATNIYLVNGDVCDRGDTPGERFGLQCVSIWAIILAYKAADPGCIHVNRGNHEDWSCNDPQGGYGKASFHAGINNKYKKVKDRFELKKAFRQLFFALPLATVLERTLVLHGGLWRACGGKIGTGFEAEQEQPAVTLEELASCDRKRDLPDGHGRQDMLMNDCVWNDPTDDDAALVTNERGGGARMFGSVVTEKFLRDNGLSLLIRSHEVTPQGTGHQWAHDRRGEVKFLNAEQKGLCMTLFSASNYCGSSGNAGAAVIFTSPAKFSVVEWSDEDAMRSWRSALVAVQKEDEEEAIREVRMSRAMAAVGVLHVLRGLIVENKRKLLSEFRAVDKSRDMRVSLNNWCKVCEKVMGDLPWRELMSELAHVEESGKVCYTHFLTRHVVRFKNQMGRHAGFQRAITDRLFEFLILEDLDLSSTIARIDKDGDGTVDTAEFGGVVAASLSPFVKPQEDYTALPGSPPRRRLPRVPLSPKEAGAVLQSAVGGAPPEFSLGPGRATAATAAPDGSLKISVDDFLMKVQMRFSSTHAKPTAKGQEWIPPFLSRVAKDIVKAQRRRQRGTVAQLMRGFFERADVDDSGYLDHEELSGALKVLPSCRELKPKQMKDLIDYCDFNGNGRVAYLEFLHSFNAGDDAAGEDLLEAVHTVLYFNYADAVRSVVEDIAAGEGRCSAGMFRAAMQAVNKTEKLLSDEQVDCLVDTLTLSADGTFDIEDYFGSFEVIDTQTDGGNITEY